MFEQELASVIKFLVDASDGAYPYYHSVPQDFMIPAVYFPDPEVSTDAETLSTYGLDYVMFVKFFAKTTTEAYRMGLTVAEGIRKVRNHIDLITETGERSGDVIKIQDPDLRMLDDGAAQLTISWRSRRLYADLRVDSPKCETYSMELFGKPYEQPTL